MFFDILKRFLSLITQMGVRQMIWNRFISRI